ncbi:P-loop containing nucleoside triphosphate hydrolase protein [Rhizophagus irregularis DAOM 181602=DAOM 197198]|nr:P-loop containing nucleoside triphosphate hydrolase protein [Rhizophagus irregularis DAOM 181602=DAOM 197198]
MYSESVFIPGDILYAWGQNEYNVYLLNKTVKKGTRPKINVSDDEFVLRSLAVDRLKKILQPNRNHSCYHVVCGEHETGKTTLIRSASRELMKKILGDTNGKDERPKWKRALEAFKRTSAVYKEKHNKSPVIDYDKIAKLVNVNPKKDRIMAKQPFEVIEQQILTEVKKKFDSAKLLQYQTHHEAEKRCNSCFAEL